MKSAVFFFGGYLASDPDMTRWLTSAQTQKPHVDFTAYSWPKHAGAGAASALAGFKDPKQGNRFQAAVDAILASTADTIYIVGHSSGCAIANEVDRALKLKDYSKINLVALDGFAPDPKQQDRSNTQVWVARSLVGKKLHKSLHFDDLQGAKHLQTYDARQDCTGKIALHFSLVNANANDPDVEEAIPKGYTNCKANLDWL